jgi:hypothetical protein
LIAPKSLVADDPLSALAECGSVLDDELARRVVALGADAVPRLYELAESAPTPDHELRWQRVHAVRLLIEIGCEETFDRLLRIFLRTLDPDVDDSEQWEAFLQYCPALGRPFLDQVFDLLENEPQHAANLAYLVYGFEGDPRTEALLDKLAETDPETAADLLCNCEDPLRLLVMVKTLEKLVRSGSQHIAMQDLADAIEKLGEHHPEHVRVHLAQLRIARHLENEWRCGRAAASGACS